MRSFCTRMVVGLIFVRLCGASSVAHAQGLEKSELTGVVRDASGAVITSALITLTGTTVIGGPRRQETTEDGQYRFTSLFPGVYEMAVEVPGFTRSIRNGIQLPLATTLRIDVMLPIAPVEQSVDVTTGAAAIDVLGSSIVTNFDERMLQALPVRRNIAEAMALAPGIANPSAVDGLPVAFGGTIGSNGLYIDGVDMNEPRRQNLWLPINYNWLDQMQIVAVGAGAEYGDFTGAIGNARLRSGTDNFSALAEYWTTHWRWVDRNGSSLISRELLSWWDANAQLGGPIRRQKLWFFTGAEILHKGDRLLGYQGQATAQWMSQVILKATSALSSTTRLEGHVQRHRSTQQGANAGPVTAGDALNQIRQLNTSWNIRLTRPFGTRSLVEARSGGYVSQIIDRPMPPGELAGPPPFRDTVTNVLSGNTSLYRRTAPIQTTSAIEFTRLGGRFRHGSHDLRVGGEFRWSESINELRYPGGRFLRGANGVPTAVTVWPGEQTDAIGRRGAMYVQDRWILTDRLTVNAGLRVDINRGSVPQGGTVFATNPVAHRLGLAWAIGTARRTVMKAHVGRYFDTMFGERIAFMDIPGLSQQVGYSVQPDGALIETFRSALPTARAIDPDIRHSFVDQYSIGVEHEVFRDTLIQAQYIRRAYEDFMAIEDTGLEWVPTQIQDPGMDGEFGTSDDGPFFTAYRNTNPGQSLLFYTNPDDAFRRFDGVQIVGSKRWSQGWQLQASYTWSKTIGTAGNGDNVNAGLNDTGEVAGNRTPGVFVNPNGLINAQGRAPYDVNEFKMLGAYRASIAGGILVSGVLWRHSGNTWERSYTYFDTLAPFSAQTIRLEPRGSRRTDPVWNLDARVEKTVSAFSSHSTLGVVVDVFNATNQGTPLNVLGTSSSLFGLAVTRAHPRMARLLVRYRF